MKLQKILCSTALSITLLSSCSVMLAYELAGSSFYAARSQSVNAARNLVGFCQFLNKANCGFEGMLLATPAYEQSFRSPRIAEYFFNTNEIRVTGSLVPNRNSNDLLADYFGL